MGLVDAIPQTIKEIGRARAIGANAGGAYGRSLADIGQLVATIPGQMREQQVQKMQDQINQQRLEAGAMELAAKKRQQLADDALSNAMAQALAPDGSIDPAKLTQHLAGTPAATKLPEILQHLNNLQESGLKLQGARNDLDASERDELGSLAAAAQAAGDDPETQSGILLAGIASRVKRNRMSQEQANPLIAGMMGDDGQPDPEKVKSTLAQLTAASKEQRTLAASDAQKKAAAESAEALAEDRRTATEQKKLQNVSRQLAATSTQAAYARVYAGIPKEFKDYFDTPDTWTKESAQRAADVFLTPDQRADNARQTMTDAETRRHNEELEKTASRRAAAAETAAARPRGTGAADQSGVYGTATKRGYDSFVENWNQRYPKPAANSFDNDGNPLPQPPPAPSLEKWYVMTPAERQRVLVQPETRIDDAEMQRRMNGGTPASVPSQSAAPSPAPQSTAKPGAGKMITLAKLRDLAKQFGMSEEDARAKAISEGYAVVK